ncbi:FliO/MopB family protein [Aquabacterium sp.]|uniref:FliO/MopB family protein n=1 Tax=Aquabacterium sp. TaxID=1872578 RepID=UPI002CBE7B83|nr:flagellar biosynthetic protein FliO [Aquabacterium sp.]HSW05745.1 flagellar biosynthetic protein FliO [Aquabacterium sp.]
MNSILGPLMAFIAVIAMIPVALWLLKRTPMGTAASQGTMRMVAQLALAPNQRVVTVEVGSGDERRWLVLGVTPGGINTLHSMPPQADVPAQHTVGALPFAAWLAKSRAGKGDEHAG